MKSFISLARGETFDTFFDSSNIELVKSLGETVWNESTHRMTADEVARNISDCENYVTLWGSPALDTRILDKAPKLKLLTHLGGTVVPFVSEEMWERGIKVISANDFFAESEKSALRIDIFAVADVVRRRSQLQCGSISSGLHAMATPVSLTVL